MSRKGAFVVTGAGSGIGQAIAHNLVKIGHHVYGLGRSREKLATTAQSIGSDRFAFSTADLSDAKSTAVAILEIRKWLKDAPLLGLVNNAGVFERLKFLDSSDAIWLSQFRNNLFSAVHLTRELYPELKAGQPSCVLNISSTLGMRPVPGTSAYSATKAAMINWSETLALEWAEDGIRVNCICPGLVDTPIHSFYGQSEESEARQLAHAAQPLGRLGTVEDIAEAACFLLSEKSQWTTGTVLKVDGGISL